VDHGEGGRDPRLRGDRGIGSSSISPSFGRSKVSEIWRDTSNVCSVKRVTPCSCIVPLSTSDMVERDHGTVGSAAAFFRESMRRDAMIGTRVVFTLWDAGSYFTPVIRQEKTYIPGTS